MLSDENSKGKRYTLGDSSGEMGYGLRISRKWSMLPKHRGSVGLLGPEYVIEAGYLTDAAYAPNRGIISLSDRQMEELFHAWLVLRKDYEDDNPELAERNRIKEEKKRRRAEGV